MSRMKLSYVFILFISTLTIGGCAAKPQLQHIPEASSATEFAKEVIAELSGGLDRAISPRKAVESETS